MRKPLDKPHRVWYNKITKVKGCDQRKKGVSTMTQKMTYVQALDSALTVVTDVEVRERLEARKASIVKRNASHSEKKYETKEQKEATALREAILSKMAVGTTYATTDILALFEDGFTTIGKVRASMTRLAKDGAVERIEDHRKIYYAIKA